jgi:hypothetical protein
MQRTQGWEYIIQHSLAGTVKVVVQVIDGLPPAGGIPDAARSAGGPVIARRSPSVPCRAATLRVTCVPLGTHCESVSVDVAGGQCRVFRRELWNTRLPEGNRTYGQDSAHSEESHWTCWELLSVS